MSYASSAVRGTAFHEAGNAVVARYFGLKVIELEIRKDGSGKTDTVGATDDLPLIDRKQFSALARLLEQFSSAAVTPLLFLQRPAHLWRDWRMTTGFKS